MLSPFGLHRKGNLCDPPEEEDNGPGMDDKDCTRKSSLNHLGRTKCIEFSGHYWEKKRNATGAKIHNSRTSTTSTLSFLAILAHTQTLPRMPRKLKEVEMTSLQKRNVMKEQQRKRKETTQARIAQDLHLLLQFKRGQVTKPSIYKAWKAPVKGKKPR